MTEPLFDEQGRVSEHLQELWNRMNGIPTAEEFQQMAAHARAKPEEYRHALYWPNADPGDLPRYRYWRSDIKRRDGKEERWCYASTRNIGGWFLGWRVFPVSTYGPDLRL